MKNVLIIFTWLLIVMVSTPIKAQIANVAPSLNKMDQNGIAIEAEGALDWKTGNSEILTGKGALIGSYRLDKNHLFLLVSGQYGEAKGSLIYAAITEHLRYRYDFDKWVGGELFLQHQYSKFRRLDRRMLAGAGPIFPFAIGDSFILSFGTAYMIEFEKYDSSSDESGLPYSDSGQERYHHRWSNFIGWKLEIDKRVQLINTTYFQPRFDALNKFKLMSELCIKVQLIDNLSLKVTILLAYNSHPAQGIEKLDNVIGNSLNLSFVL